jgi:2-C-methyl-D-erythritol 4-phosphate cytidylyltransferase
MIYAGILAGGKGTRMGRTELPKQFLTIGSKPIIIHTLEQFIISNKVDQIIVATPENWKSYTEDIIEKYYPNNEQINIVIGGSTRNETIMNICKFIKENSKDKENIVLTHDAVRPFITQRIINDNIEAMLDKKVDAVDTVIPAHDTIVESTNNDIITNIPIRDYMYQGQTPQTFRVDELMNIYESLKDEEKDILTDAAKIYVLKSKNVKIVQGETFNMKITTQHDLKLANAIVKVKGEMEKND